MNPSSSDPTASFEALRQLKTLLDQGALTQAEYDTLKQRLLQSGGPATAASSSMPDAIPAPAVPAYSPPADVPAPSPAPAPSAGELPSLLDMFQQTPTTPPAPAPTPAPTPYQRPTPPAEPVATKIVPVAPIVVSQPVAPEVSFLPSTPPPPAPPVPPMPAAPEFIPPVRSEVTPPTSYSTPPVANPSYQPLPTPPPVPSPAPEPAFSTLLDTPPAEPYHTTPPAVEPEADFVPVPAAPASRALPTILLVLGGLALLLVLGYLFMGRDQTDEHLTSRSQTAADSVAVNPETGPQDEQATLPPVVEPEVVRTAPVAPVATPAPADSAANTTSANPSASGNQPEEEAVFPSKSGTTKPAADKSASDKPAAEESTFPTPAPGTTSAPAATEPAGPATAAEDGDDEATTSARQALGRYYSDLQAPPFNAPQHFAPTVERLYTRQNLTPAAIEEDLNRSMFPEFKQRVTRIVPGTLRVGPPAADGTRTATYTEQSRAFRVSKNQFQRTKTQVRVRFNPEFKMTYMRQEKLLENIFE